MKIKSLPTLLLLPLLVDFVSFLQTARAQNLITNGGFETPPIAEASFATLQAISPDLTGWQIQLDSVDLIRRNGGSIIGAPFEGEQYVDISGTPGPGRLLQTFATTPGQQYVVEFSYSHNYAAAPGGASGSVRVLDSSGPLLEATVSHSTSASGNLDWRPFSQTFTATRSSTSLEFTSLTPGNGGVLLDGISITPSQPVLEQVQSSIFTAVEVTFLATTGKTYQVQSSFSLAPAAWTNFGSPIMGDGSEKSIFDKTRNEPKRFYRVVVIP